jgi:hypothetical protein
LVGEGISVTRVGWRVYQRDFSRIGRRIEERKKRDMGCCLEPVIDGVPRDISKEAKGQVKGWNVGLASKEEESWEVGERLFNNQFSNSRSGSGAGYRCFVVACCVKKSCWMVQNGIDIEDQLKRKFGVNFYLIQNGIV